MWSVLGLLLALGLWTKTTASYLIPAYVVAFGLLAYRHRETARGTITAGIAAIALGLGALSLRG